MASRLPDQSWGGHDASSTFEHHMAIPNAAQLVLEQRVQVAQGDFKFEKVDSQWIDAPMDFEITFTNPGDNHLGVNEYGLPLVYFGFFLGHCIMCAVQRRSKQLYHEWGPLQNLTTCCVLITCAGTGLLALHWMLYGLNGSGVPLLRFAGRCLQFLARLVLLGVLLLLAEGWCIVRAEVQRKRLIITLLGALFWGQLFLLIWGGWEASSQQEEDNGLMASFRRDPASTPPLLIECMRLPRTSYELHPHSELGDSLECLRCAEPSIDDRAWSPARRRRSRPGLRVRG